MKGKAAEAWSDVGIRAEEEDEQWVVGKSFAQNFHFFFTLTSGTSEPLWNLWNSGKDVSESSGMTQEVHEAMKRRCGFGFATRATCSVLTGNHMFAASLRMSGVNVSSRDITGSRSLFSKNVCCTLVSSCQKEPFFSISYVNTSVLLRAVGPLTQEGGRNIQLAAGWLEQMAFQLKLRLLANAERLEVNILTLFVIQRGTLQRISSPVFAFSGAVWAQTGVTAWN